MNLRTLVRRIAFALRPGGTRANSGLAKVMTAIAAGTFTATELTEARVRQWAWFGDEHGSRKQGLFPWEVRFYSPYLKPGVRVLVVGAGSGRDVLCFLRAGCVVTALDESASTLDKLRLRLERAERDATVICGSIADFVSSERFDAVIFAWLTYIYIPLRSTRVEALRRAADVLAPGGEVLISFEPGVASTGLRRIARVTANLVGGTPPEDFGHFFCSGPARLPLVYQSRFFTAAEIRAEAAEAGLVVAGQHDGTPAEGAGATDDPGTVALRLNAPGSDPASL